MSPAEAAALLTIAAAYDNRKPDADAAQAWAMALDSLRFEDARAVIVDHYRTKTDWLMPAHVVAGVRRLRTERLMAYGALTPPAELDPSDAVAYQRWMVDTQTAIGDGRLTRDVVIAGELTERTIEGLGELMPRPPRVNPTAKAHDPEHAQKMAAAKAELAARPEIPVAEPLTTEQEAS